MLKEEIIACIAKDLGSIIPINHRGSEKWTNFAHIKVSISINKSLRTDLVLLLPNNANHQVHVLYEKVPRFCLFCRIIGHEELGCKWLSEVDHALKNLEEEERQQLKLFLGHRVDERKYQAMPKGKQSPSKSYAPFATSPSSREHLPSSVITPIGSRHQPKPYP